MRSGPRYESASGSSRKDKLDAAHENRPDGHERERLAGTVESAADDRAFISAVDARHPLPGDRIDVPHVARNIRRAVYFAVRGRMEPVIHVGRQAKRDVDAAAKPFGRRSIVQEFTEGVARCLGLHEFRAFDRAERTDDAVTRADQHIRIGIERPRAIFQLPYEAVVQAGETGLFGFVQAEVAGEEAEQRDRQIPDDALFDSAEPAHEPGEEAPRHPVRDDEIDALLMERAFNERG